MNGDPVVTLCIPSYSHAQFLGAAIDSVLRQSMGDFELLVVDDGSTDGSLALALEYASCDPRVRVLRHEGGANRGVTATVNAGFAAARGTYVASLAADDVLYPDSFARRVAPLEADSTLGFVYGRIEVLDPAGLPVGKIAGLAPEAICAFDRTTDPLVSLLLHNYMPAPSVLMRRELLKRLGTFDERIYYVDWELWIRLLAHSRVGFVEGLPLAGYRIHGHALTPEDDAADLPRRLDLYRALDEKASSVGGRFESPRIRALASLQRGAQAAELGEEGEAAAALRAAFDTDAALGGDVDFLFWWLAPLQRRRLRGSAAAQRREWLWTFTNASADAAAVVEAGAQEGELGFWALHNASRRIPTRIAVRLCWGLVANELEGGVHGGTRLRVVVAALRRALRDPSLLHDRWFLKILLCAGGLWGPVARTRLWAIEHRASRMGDRGFEPRTSALSERRSNQLS
jgi:glycosyltransferase involved in cell wall biosynthesis